LAVGPDGTIYTSDKGNATVPDRIVKVHPHSGVQTIVTQFDNGHVTGIQVDSSGMVFFGLIASLDGIYRLDPSAGQRERIAQSNGADWPGGIALVKAASAVSCSPRPRVQVRTSNLGSGRLQVTIKATGGGNTVRTIQPGSSPYAALEAQPTIVGADASFVVRRTAPGAVTLPLTITDGCGDWPTFVGGGPNAF
jgi:hypothetical protein